MFEGIYLGLVWVEKKKKFNFIFIIENVFEYFDICDILDEYEGVVFVIVESLYCDLSILGMILFFLVVVDLLSLS